MNRTPRASLAISILDDEDYAALCQARGGMEAFGVFVAVVIVGRQRLGRERAHRIEGTEALQFDDGVAHVVGLAKCSRKQLDKCLEVLAAVAKETGSKPWMHLDKGGRLIIRSFFKFNTTEGWGGSRPGSGRKSSDDQTANQDAPQKNQLDSAGNQLETNLKPSCCASYYSYSSVSFSDSDSVYAADAEARAPQRPRIVRPPTPELRENAGPGRDSPEAVELAAWAEQFGQDRKGDSYAHYARQTCDYVPAEWLWALLRRKVEGATNKPNIAVLRAIMKDWVEAGECQFLVRPAPIKTHDPNAQYRREQELAEKLFGVKGDTASA